MYIKEYCIKNKLNKLYKQYGLIDDKAEMLTTFIFEVCNIVLGKRYIKVKSKPPWWTSVMIKARKNIQESTKDYLKYNQMQLI